MTNNPTFNPGDMVFSIQYGVGTVVNVLEIRARPNEPDVGRRYEAVDVQFSDETILNRDFCGKYMRFKDAKLDLRDVARSLYTLAEAEQYGWYKPEPLRVEFERAVCYSDVRRALIIELPNQLSSLQSKRVRVTVEELP